MGKPITNITIVGGGTAGWLAAAYLNHRLQWGPTARPGVTISVIEPPNIATVGVGVGEATVPTLKGTLCILEISEAEFMLRTNASLKLGIRFDDWQVGEAGKFVSYVHPFTGGASVRGRNPGYSFQAHGLPGVQAKGRDFVRTISHTREAIELFKGARPLDAPPFAGPLNYAYHIDAALLADFLKEVCLARGVTHVADEVTGVALDERGYVGALELKARGTWPVELVIDCTGFGGLIINGALREPFVSYADYLPNDRAISTQILREDISKITPATIATAMEAGWTWRIPLHSRDGIGYVYSSAFKSDEAAHDEFMRHLDGAQKLCEPRVLKMRVGRNRRSWVKNCVAIGPASGFLEPLESTSILSSELAARWLVRYFPSMDFEAPLARQFNSAVERFYDEVRDLLNMHFSLSNRADTPYWHAARHEVKKSDTLLANLELWKHAMPGTTDPRTDTVFGSWNVQCVLFGKGFYEGTELAGTEAVPKDVWNHYWAGISATKSATLAALPDHFALLEFIRARAVAGESAARKPTGREFTVSDEVMMAATQLISPLRPMSRTAWHKTAQAPQMITEQPSPFVIGPEQTEIRGDAAGIAAVFGQKHAVALTDVIEPAFFEKLLRICDTAQYVTDTVMDRAHRQRERPGKAGFALSLALKRANLLRWLEQATGTPLLESAYGRVLQFGPDEVDRLNWHDDLPDDPLRRLAITINLTQAPYEGGLFELRVKKTGEVLFQHRHTTLGSALIFAVSDKLQHRVWPVTAGGPRRVFTGWFTEHESSFI